MVPYSKTLDPLQTARFEAQMQTNQWSASMGFYRLNVLAFDQHDPSWGKQNTDNDRKIARKTANKVSYSKADAKSAK